MGNVKSFCCKDTVSEIDDHEERSRILNDNCDNNSTSSAVSHQDSISYGSVNNGYSSKTLEQSALDKIYQKMTSNVIDVAPGESMVIQQAEFMERQKAYQAKLNLIKTPLPLRLTNRVTKHVNSSFDNSHLSANDASSSSTSSNLPQHVNKSEEKRGVEYEPISTDDIKLINEISRKSARAIRNLKINSQEQVVAHFQP